MVLVFVVVQQFGQAEVCDLHLGRSLHWRKTNKQKKTTFITMRWMKEKLLSKDSAHSYINSDMFSE